MNPVLKVIAKVHTAVYQMSGGRLGRKMGGQDVLLLHHVGARSGRNYTTPVAYVRDGDAYVLIAAAAGQPKHPGWYHNLKKNPNATINLAGEQRRVVAEVAHQEKRDKLWTAIAAEFPNLRHIRIRRRA